MDFTSLLGSGGGGGKTTSAAASSGVTFGTDGSADKTALYVVAGFGALALLALLAVLLRR